MNMMMNMMLMSKSKSKNKSGELTDKYLYMLFNMYAFPKNTEYKANLPILRDIKKFKRHSA